MAEEKPVKKPFYKQVWFWGITALVLVVGAMSASGNDQNRQEQNENEQISIEEDQQDPDKKLPDGIKCATNSVRNDTTGKWKIVSIAEPVDVSQYATEYYGSCFKDDSEIHAIVNFTYKTTTKIAYTAGMINVTVYEYVDGEEHDANKLFSGMKLSDDFYNAESGDKLDLE